MLDILLAFDWLIRALRQLVIGRPKLGTYRVCCKACKWCETGITTAPNARKLVGDHAYFTGHIAKITEE